MKEIQFYKIRNVECDFCGEKKKVITQANNKYICAKCAREINKHARMNEFVVNQENKRR